MNFAKPVLLAAAAVIVAVGIFVPGEEPQDEKSFTSAANDSLRTKLLGEQKVGTTVFTSVTLDSLHVQGSTHAVYAGHLERSKKKVYLLVPASCYPHEGDTVDVIANNLTLPIPAYIMSPHDKLCDDTDDTDEEENPDQLAGVRFLY